LPVNALILEGLGWRPRITTPLHRLGIRQKLLERHAIVCALGYLARECLPTADRDVGEERSISMPKQTRPQECAAISVVPLPRNGS
jgi:hypothetical protein